MVWTLHTENQSLTESAIKKVQLGRNFLKLWDSNSQQNQ